MEEGDILAEEVVVQVGMEEEVALATAMELEEGEEAQRSLRMGL